MRYAVFALALVGALAFAVATQPSRPVKPPCESGMWQEQFSGGYDGYENVCMIVDRPSHRDPIPSFSYSLDV